MRMRSKVGVGLVLGAMLFHSCTCRSSVPEPPKVQEPAAGFHVSTKPTPSPAEDAAIPTATAATPKTKPTQTQPVATPTKPAAVGATPVDLPSDFPSDVPIFAGSRLSQVQDMANKARNVILTVNAPVPEVVDFYRRKLQGAGWRTTQEFSRDNHAFATYEKGKVKANITVASDPEVPGQQIIAIMYEEEQPLEFDEF